MACQTISTPVLYTRVLVACTVACHAVASSLQTAPAASASLHASCSCRHLCYPHRLPEAPFSTQCNTCLEMLLVQTRPCPPRLPTGPASSTWQFKHVQGLQWPANGSGCTETASPQSNHQVSVGLALPTMPCHIRFPRVEFANLAL